MAVQMNRNLPTSQSLGKSLCPFLLRVFASPIVCMCADCDCFSPVRENLLLGFREILFSLVSVCWPCRIEEFLEPAAEKISSSPVTTTSTSLIGKVKASWKNWRQQQID